MAEPADPLPGHEPDPHEPDPHEPGTREPDLWERLIAGRVTEVFTFSARGLVFDLPQTLGLEPISFDAYVYDRDGVARDSEDLDRIARELAAQPRWICNAGPLFWARHFAEAAEVVLVFPSVATAAENRFSDAAALLDSAVTGALRFLRDRAKRALGRGARRAEAGAEDSAFVPLEDLRPRGPAPTYATRLVNLLVNEFPQKTFLLKHAEDVAALQAVRALPPLD